MGFQVNQNPKNEYILLIMTIYRIYNRDLFYNLHNHTTQSNIKDNEINKYHFWLDAIRFVLNGQIRTVSPMNPGADKTASKPKKNYLGQDSKTCEKVAIVNTLRVCVRYCAKNYKAYPDCDGPSKLMSA